mmetsp:Transcript_29814/g.88289  ORF Transcript_29814/g.88289 Transcript_29814/m.88289 type:complete len:224 (-) Transcript_29814:58-729(-)
MRVTMSAMRWTTATKEPGSARTRRLTYSGEYLDVILHISISISRPRMSSATTAARAATVGLLTLPKLPNGGPPMPPLLGPGLAAATATPRRPAPPALHPEMTAAALLHGCGRDEAAVPAVEKVGATRPCAGRVGTAADAAAAGGGSAGRPVRRLDGWERGTPQRLCCAASDMVAPLQQHSPPLLLPLLPLQSRLLSRLLLPLRLLRAPGAARRGQTAQARRRR